MGGETAIGGCVGGCAQGRMKIDARCEIQDMNRRSVRGLCGTKVLCHK